MSALIEVVDAIANTLVQSNRAESVVVDQRTRIFLPMVATRGMQEQGPSSSGLSAVAEVPMVAAGNDWAPCAEGLTCAICLDKIEVANLADIPECQHQYCGEHPSSRAWQATACAHTGWHIKQEGRICSGCSL